MFKHLIFAFVFFISPTLTMAQVSSFSINENIINKKYNEVCFPSTHNSFNYLIGPKQFIYPNQRYDIPQQLKDGIRGFMIDIHSYNGLNIAKRKQKEVDVFHQFALLGYEPLGAILNYFFDFLEQHPSEIISIIFDCTVEDSEKVISIFEKHPIYKYLFHKNTDAEWPSIAKMQTQNQRLVVFTHCNSQSDWYLNQDQFCFENDYNNHSAADYQCNIIRGDTSKSVFIMNHFLYHFLNRKRVNANTNEYASLMSHANYCQKKTGHIPNFLTVDWYDKGALFRVVNELNSR